MNKEETIEEWDLTIEPKSGLLDLKLKDVWRYRDLLMMFVHRDFVAVYKQTLLGPLWFFLQPIITTLTFTVVFGNIAQMSTDGLPKILFYMSGIIGWNYFADCLTGTSGTFTANASIFGKVFFPRLIVPLSTIISNLLKFLIQFSLFILFLIYFNFFEGKNINPDYPLMLLMPLLLILMAGLGLGLGIIISSVTIKYKDLRFIVNFGVQLLMYTTPVIYSAATYNKQKYGWIVQYNPMTPVIETFRLTFLGGTGTFNPNGLGYSGVCMIVILLIGLVLFNRVERNFMDTV